MGEYDESGNGLEISIELYDSVDNTVRNDAIKKAERIADIIGGPLSLILLRRLNRNGQFH